MKKHLIVAAVSAAVAVPALAQVTVYGTIDSGVISVNKVGTSDTTSVSQTNVQGSLYTTNRFGIRGSEDLGGGLKGEFGVESGFSSDDAADLSFGSRGAFVGASGAFGSVRIGGKMTSLVDATVTGSAGNFSNIGNLISAAASARPANSVVYESPTFSGVRAQVVLGQGEGTTQNTKDNGDYQSLGLTGKVGAFSFTVVRASSKSQSGAGTATRCVAFLGNSTGSGNAITGSNSTIGYGPTDGSCSVTRYATVSTAADQWSANSTGTGFGAGINALLAQGVDQFVVLSAGARATGAFNYKTEETGLVLAYDFGVANVQYNTLAQKTSGNLGVGTTSSATAATNSAVDRRAQGLTVTVPAGAITPFVAYMELEDKLDARKDAEMTSVGVNYALSKRTNAYAVWSEVDRGETATTTHRGATAAGVAGSKSTGMAIGLRHSF